MELIDSISLNLFILKKTLSNKGFLPVLGTCPDCSTRSDYIYMNKMSFSQPFMTLLIFFLPLIIYMSWFHYQGQEFSKASVHLNAVDIYTINLIDSLNPISIEIKHEIGGRIILLNNEITNAGIILGSYSHTRIPIFMQSPFTGKALAQFHTHGNDDPNYDNENFSISDTLNCQCIQYLGTPKGKILKHIPNDNVVMQYDRISNQWFPLGNAHTIKRILERK